MMATLVTVVLVLAVVGGRYYVRIARRIAAEGGKVNSAPYALPEAIFAVALGGFLTYLAYRGFTSAAVAVTSGRLVQSAQFFGFIVTGIVVLLKIRQHSLTELFGLWRLPLLQLPGRALLLLLAAFPMVAALNLLMQQLMHDREDLQEIVKFFLQANERHDYAAVVTTVVLAGVVAPVFEEFIFRGFFYGVARRYFGIVPAMIAVSVLFGAVHANLAAWPGLTLLSICFCLAYEKTGSLFTSMIMHALFNLTSLVLMMLSLRAMP
jgi:membrane protease YdiL (CAAX protease family)